MLVGLDVDWDGLDSVITHTPLYVQIWDMSKEWLLHPKKEYQNSRMTISYNVAYFEIYGYHNRLVS